MTEVKLNKAEFDERVSDLKTSANNVGKVKFNDMQLTNTNVSRLKKICEAIEKLSKDMKEYETMLEADLKRIQKTGDEMVAKDEQLGKSMN